VAPTGIRAVDERVNADAEQPRCEGRIRELMNGRDSKLPQVVSRR